MGKYNFSRLLAFDSSDYDKLYQLCDIFDAIEECLEKKDEEIADLKTQLSDLKVLAYEIEERLNLHLDYD